MLVLMLGASGVGKSTIIQTLVQTYGWSPLVSIVTRPERPDEMYKMSVSERSYSMLAATGKLWSSVEQHGARYGLLRVEVEVAIADMQRFHVVDYGLSTRQQYFAGVPHHVVLVAAGDAAELEARIIASGRGERASSSRATAAELDAWFAEHGASCGAFRIVNREGASAAAAEDVARGVSLATPQGTRVQHAVASGDTTN